MGTLLLERPQALPEFLQASGDQGAAGGPVRWAGREFDGPLRARGGSTLDELLTGVWEDLAVRAVAHCPVCGGEMAAQERPDGSRHGLCGDCGSRLS